MISILACAALIAFMSVATWREWPIYGVAAFLVGLWAILMIVYRDRLRSKR